MADESENASSSEESPLIAPQSDVDRLLKEAESLVDEIAETVGIDPDDTAGSTDADADAATGSIAAGDTVDEDVEAIDRLIAESESRQVATEPDEKPDRVLGKCSQEQSRDRKGAVLDPEARPLPHGRGSEQASKRSSEQSDPPGDSSKGRHIELVDKSASAAAGSSDKAGAADAIEAEIKAEIEAAGDDLDSTMLDEPSGSPAPDEADPGLSRRERALAFAKRAAPALRNGAIGVPNALLKLLVVIDRPFSGLSTRTKLHIEVLAIFTVLMGILSFALPPLLDGNPYADMPP